MVLNQQKSSSHNIDYNKINFFDCLNDYFKSTTLDIDNLRRCEYCHKENHSIIQYRMKTCKNKSLLLSLLRLLLIALASSITYTCCIAQ